MSHPGKYTIQVQMPDPENPALHMDIKSNKVDVTVTP
jgi:hypothetical protein